MLQHVVETQPLDRVVRRVDFLVGVLELRLDHKRRRIPVSTGRGVVGAGIPAFGFDVGDVAVLLCQLCITGKNRRRLTVVITPLMNWVRPGSTKSTITPTDSGSPASSIP